MGVSRQDVAEGRCSDRSDSFYLLEVGFGRFGDSGD